MNTTQGASKLPYILLLLASFFWATNLIAAKFVNDSIPPIMLTFLRWFSATLIIAPFIAKSIVQKAQIIRKHLTYLIAMGLLTVTLFNSFLYLGIAASEVNKASILQSLTPVIILLICAFVLKEKASSLQWLGVFISFVGVTHLVTEGDIHILLTFSIQKGDMYILLAMLCWGVYSIALRWRPTELDDLSFFGLTSVFGTLGLAPWVYYENTSAGFPDLDLPSALTVLYIAIFPSIISGLFWNRAVAQVGPATAGMFVHTMPIFSFVLSAIFLDETLKSYHLIGLVFVLSGVFFALHKRPN